MDSQEKALLSLLAQLINDVESALSAKCADSLIKLKPLLKCIVESLLGLGTERKTDEDGLALALRLCEAVLVRGQQQCAPIVPLELISLTGKILPQLLGSDPSAHQTESVLASLQTALRTAVACITDGDGIAADGARRAAAVIKVVLRCRTQIGKEERTDHSADIELAKSLVSSLFEDDTSLKHGHTLCFVISLLVEANPEVVSNVLQLVRVDGRSTEAIQSSLALICAVQEQLFVKRHEEYFLGDDFWKCVQFGLADVDNLARKRGLFLAKRSVDYVFRTYTDSSVPPTCSTLAPFNTRRMEEMKSLWDDLLLVFDCAEEKQMHMVRQIDARIRHLSRHCSDRTSSSRPIHVSWLTTVYRQLLAHENPAVQKWALHHFMDTCDLSAVAVMDFITGPLLGALNTTKAFGREEAPTLEARFQSFLARATRDLDSEALTAFWNHLLLSVMDKSWGPVPIFYVVQTLHSQAPSSITLPWSLVVVAARFATTGVQFLDILPRCAVQTFVLELMFRCSVAPSVLEAADLLCAFCGKKQIVFFGTNLWTLASEWIQRASGRDEETRTDQDKMAQMLKVIESSQGAQQQLRVAHSLALQLALSFESAQTLVDSEFVSILHREIEECLLRPYGSARLKACLLLLLAIEVLSDRPRRRRGKPSLVFGADLDAFLLDVPAARTVFNEVALRGLLRLVQESSSVEDLNVLLLHVLKAAVKCSSKTLDDLMEQAAKKLFAPSDTAQNSFESPDVVVCVMALGFVVEKARKLPSPAASHIPQNLNLGRFPLPFPELSRAGNSDPATSRTVEARKDQLTSRGIGAVFSRQQWIILSAVLSDSNGDSSAAESVLDLAIEALEVESAECFAHVVSCVRSVMKQLMLVRSVEVINKLKGFIGQCKLTVTEQRKVESFWTSLGAFCDLCFEPSLLSSALVDHELAAVAGDLLDESHSIPGIAVCLSKSLCSGAVNSERLPAQLMPILAKLIVFGPVHKKDSLMVFHANRTIMALGSRVPANLVEGSDEAMATAVRVSAVAAVLRLLRQRRVAAGDVVAVLREEDKAVTGGKTRHYENSAVHLTRHRMLQCLLLMTDVCADNETDRVLLFEEAARFLSEEAQQFSVRYLAEWILVVLCSRCATCERLLSEAMARAVEDRMSVMTSFLVIITHVALLSSHEERKAKLREALDLVSPWCLSQQFGIRLCALQCFRKLYEAAAENFDAENSFQQRYGFMLECLEASLQQGKNTAKLGEDFYLSVFHPYDHLNMTDIFVDFPRLTGLPPAEYNGGHLLENLAAECSTIELKNGHGAGLGTHCVSETITRLCWCVSCCETRKKRSDGEGDRAVDARGDDDEDIVQKKPTPWSSMPIATEDALSVDSERSPSFPDLMVVASLIERLPNLGGLCRTCEILGVGTYVIGNKKYCDATEFRNTSVSAHRWVPIEEVRSFELAAFLAEKRDEGYRIVAVEQTSHSVSLQRYKFPSKTVLLLGNESEGIPAALFQLVDDCVEIPQQGVIRSFNVHVTGALVLWEYVRQFTA